jgi:hypothetical protein
MPGIKSIAGIPLKQLAFCLTITLIINFSACKSDPRDIKRGKDSSAIADSINADEVHGEYLSGYSLMVLPKNPAPGEPFRILAAGGKSVLKCRIIVNGQSGNPESLKSKTGEELPCWRIEDFAGSSAGKYEVTLILKNSVVRNLKFEISQVETAQSNSVVWKTLGGWDSDIETIYSVWINALFHDFDEQASWTALHEVTRNKNQNFLYNYLSMGGR